MYLFSLVLKLGNVHWSKQAATRIVHVEKLQPEFSWQSTKSLHESVSVNSGHQVNLFSVSLILFYFESVFPVGSSTTSLFFFLVSTDIKRKWETALWVGVRGDLGIETFTPNNQEASRNGPTVHVSSMGVHATYKLPNKNPNWRANQCINVFTCTFFLLFNM